MFPLNSESPFPPTIEPDEALLKSLELLQAGNQRWNNVIAEGLIAIGKTRRESAAGSLSPDLREFTDQVLGTSAALLTSSHPDQRKLGVEIFWFLYFGEYPLE